MSGGGSRIRISQILLLFLFSGKEEKDKKKGNKNMARKGNPISVRLDLNRSSDSSRFSEGDRESHRMGQSFPSVCPIFKKYSVAWEDVADVRDGHDFF